MHEIFGHVFTSQVDIIEFNTNEYVNILSDPSPPPPIQISGYVVAQGLAIF